LKTVYKTKDVQQVANEPGQPRVSQVVVDKTAALYAVDGWINNGHVVRMVNHWYWSIRRSSMACAKSAAKDVGMKYQG